MAGPPKSSKDSGTIRSRRVHCFIFCHDLTLDDDLLLLRAHQERRNWQMAMHAAHLATGSTLHYRTIRGDTMAKCLLNVAKFIQRFPRWTPQELFHNDPRHCLAHDTEFAPCIADALAECRRWDGVKNWCEGFNIEMWECLDTMAKHHPPDSLWPVCRDFFGAALYGGFRLSEWAQHDSHPDPFSPMIAPNNSVRAFTLKDVQFFTDKLHPLGVQAALAFRDPTTLRLMLNFSWQKNGEHGEDRLFTHDNTKPHMSFIRLFSRMIEQFSRLVDTRHSNVPLSVCQREDGVIRSATANDISTVMRAVAAKLHKLDPRKKSHAKILQRWSSHSLRVGACGVLFAMGFTEDQMQFPLRWKSRAFVACLRNLATLSKQQNQAMADLSAMPNVA